MEVRVNAWAIVIAHNLDKVDSWVESGEKKVDAIKYKVGGPSNAWRILIAHRLDEVDTWVENAERKVGEIKHRVGGASYAWGIIIDQGLDNVDSWVEAGEEVVRNMVEKEAYTKSEAWKRVISKGLKLFQKVTIEEGKTSDIIDKLKQESRALTGV